MRVVIMLWMVVLALLCASTVEFDGVVKGRSLASSIVCVHVGHRVVALGTHMFRPGRVYWRITLS